jgi:hypothetical protein
MRLSDRWRVSPVKQAIFLDETPAWPNTEAIARTAPKRTLSRPRPSPRQELDPLAICLQAKLIRSLRLTNT